MMVKLLAATTLVSMALASSGLTERAACNADNCLRAVRGTRRPGGLAGGLAECSAYFGTPSDSEVTPALPTYVARPCQSNVARYSSACACAAGTTPTSTATSTPTPTPSTCGFNVLVVSEDPNFGGYYLSNVGGTVEALYKSTEGSTVFNLLPNQQVYQVGNTADVWASFTGPSTVQLVSSSGLPPKSQTGFSSDQHAIYCSASLVGGQYSGPLSCQDYAGLGYGYAQFQFCENSGLRLIVDGVVNGGFDTCYGVSLTAVPVTQCQNPDKI